MINDVMQLLRFIQYKIRFPRSKIAFGAYVDQHATLDTRVRVLPGAEIYNSKIGIGVTVSNNCIVTNSRLERHNKLYRECWLWEVQMGAYSYVAPRAEISMTSIGRFCSIGARFQCSIGDHPVDFVSTSPMFFSPLKQCGVSFTDKELFKERTGITIANDVWIGAGVFIKDGTRIGNGAIVAAGSVVINDVPDYAIVGGVPAKLIHYRFPEDIIVSLLTIQWWNWDEEKLRRAQPVMANNDHKSFIAWAQNEP